MTRFFVELRNFWRLAAGLVLLAATAGCEMRGGPIPYDPPNFVAPPSAQDRPFALPVVLVPGDVVSVRVYRVDALSGDQTVDESGRIKMPLVGPLPAAGKTVDGLQTEIAHALGDKYLTNPDVQVTLKTRQPLAVTVDGAVGQPGVYQIAGQTNLIQAVAMARGTIEGANTRRVVVFRNVQGQRMAASFDFKSIRRGESPNPVIYPEDIVVVDGSSITATWKQVLQTLPLVAFFRPFG
jgi:polysaccharide export outer membrane protein